MARLIENARTLMGDSETVKAWTKWNFTRVFSGQPYLDVLGVKLSGFPSFSSYLGIWKARPDEEELSYLSRMTAEANVVFDIGANFGSICSAIKHFSPDCTIHAFEPTSATAAALRYNIRRNSLESIVVVESAVGDDDGVILFNISADDPATNKFVAGGGEGVEVKVLKLDTYCNDNHVETIDFLKVDVEGAELSVLNGARGLFEKKAIKGGMIEICPDNLEVFGLHVSDIVNFFDQVGYGLFRFDHVGSELVPTRFENVVAGDLINAGFGPLNSPRKVS